MDLKNYLYHQKEEMEKYKWCESQRAGHDLGEAALREWVEKYGKNYREEYKAILEELIKKTTERCKDKLKNQLPTVSDEIWNHFMKTVIIEFTDLWNKEIIITNDPNKKKHLEEI